LTVTFSSSMAAGTVNNLSNWKLTEAGGDASFGTSDDQQITLALASQYSSGTAVTRVRRGRCRRVGTGSRVWRG
jgi:hypothetical protein